MCSEKFPPEWKGRRDLGAGRGVNNFLGRRKVLKVRHVDGQKGRRNVREEGR